MGASGGAAPTAAGAHVSTAAFSPARSARGDGRLGARAAPRGGRAAREPASRASRLDAITLEARVDAESGDDRRAHVAQTPRGIERLLEAGPDNLQIDGGVEPARDRDVVVHLDRVLAIQPEVELLAEERHEVVAELDAGPAHAEGVERPDRRNPRESTRGPIVSILPGPPRFGLGLKSAISAEALKLSASGEKTVRNASDVARAAARSCSTTRGSLPTIPAARRLGPPRRRDAGSRPATPGSCRDFRDRRR